MDIVKFRTNTLFWIFIKQLLKLSVALLLEIAIIAGIFVGGVEVGFLLPADYAENYLLKYKSSIAQSDPFDVREIPFVCCYGLFDHSGTFLYGNLSSSQEQAAVAYLREGKDSHYRFMVIERSDGYCVVQYDIHAHFASRKLHRLFPNLELYTILLYILFFVLIVIRTALSFGKKLKKELAPLLEEIHLIQTQELSMDRKSSGIDEFNEILIALHHMKSALSQSLQNEWSNEQQRQSNISSLAHDIKTPLTIIKGNAELIKEEEQLEEIYQRTDEIIDNSDKIERYIRLLINEATCSNTTEQEEEINIVDFAANIISESEVLCRLSAIDLVTDNRVTSARVLMNRDAILRAILNLVKNAIEHHGTRNQIHLILSNEGNIFQAVIEDYGKGFSEGALMHAVDRFYTERTERSGEHYGLGMYYANSIAEEYHGVVLCQNKPNQNGALVTFRMQLTRL